MKRKNKYANRSKISDKKVRQIVRLFASDWNASQIAKQIGLNRNTVNRYLKEIRKRIANYCETQSIFSGKVEVHEIRFLLGLTYVLVLGIFQRYGKVYTQIVPDFSEDTLEAVIRARVSPESIFYFHYRASDGLFDVVSNFKVYNYKDLFEPNLDGIQSFWAYARSRFLKLRGMSQPTFHLHLKECEFRFNHETEDLYAILLTICREHPLF